MDYMFFLGNNKIKMGKNYLQKSQIKQTQEEKKRIIKHELQESAQWIPQVTSDQSPVSMFPTLYCIKR